MSDQAQARSEQWAITQEIMRRTKTDVHSLGKWRVNAALRNIEDFYTAFDIKEGDAMFLAPEERINIW